MHLMKGKTEISAEQAFLTYQIRYTAQSDEIARLQLENGVLQEKLTNEKRKTSILQVHQAKLTSFLFSFMHLYRVLRVKCKEYWMRKLD